MAQITININSELESKIKEIVSSQKTSISKYILSIVEREINSSWNPKVKKLAGSWSDFPSIEEIRSCNIEDTKREEL